MATSTHSGADRPVLQQTHISIASVQTRTRPQSRSLDFTLVDSLDDRTLTLTLTCRPRAVGLAHIFGPHTHARTHAGRNLLEPQQSRVTTTTLGGSRLEQISRRVWCANLSPPSRRSAGASRARKTNNRTAPPTSRRPRAAAALWGVLSYSAHTYTHAHMTRTHTHLTSMSIVRRRDEPARTEFAHLLTRTHANLRHTRRTAPHTHAPFGFTSWHEYYGPQPERRIAAAIARYVSRIL